MTRLSSSCFFFFNDTATTEIYTLSLHDALPIFPFHSTPFQSFPLHSTRVDSNVFHSNPRSEERFSRNAETDLVCRLLLEKKKTKPSRACRQSSSRTCCLNYLSRPPGSYAPHVWF